MNFQSQSLLHYITFAYIPLAISSSPIDFTSSHHWGVSFLSSSHAHLLSCGKKFDLNRYLKVVLMIVSFTICRNSKWMLLKSRDITLPTNLRLVKAVVFSGSHLWMGELDYKESWVPNNWYFWTVVLEKTLEGLLDWQEIQPVDPKGSQSWIFIGRTDDEAESPI